ncbi:MAG: hypothetical protein NVSMB25_03280 [Thermoleophilaceae bacterium]
MASTFDDELWELVPAEAQEPPVQLADFVRSLGRVASALDLGCGDGRLTALVDAGRVTAADVSTVALERARGRAPHAEPLLLEPDARLPLADSSFDLVLCAETIEHVRDTQLLLSESRRVLRPGGRLALTTPAHGRATALSLLLRGFESHFDPFSAHLRFYTRRSLAGALESCGFDVLELRRVSGTLLVVARR